MNEQFNPHEILWERKKSERFWNYYFSDKSREPLLFSKQFGDALIDFAQSHIRLHGRILDFGCGRGFLLEKLFERNIPGEGLDFSISSVNHVSEKFKNNPYFKGTLVAEKFPLPLADNEIDCIFLIETIEHLLPEDLEQTLREIHRIIKAGGHIVVTTPFDENLDTRKIICPECGCIFHRTQHVSSWPEAKLSDLMHKFGFREILCKATTLRPRSKFNYLRNMISRIRKHTNHHLLYIGEKP